MVIKGLLATWAHHVNYSYYTTKSNDAQRTLYDIRDGNSYRIRKLADGNCWMTENLYLGNDTDSFTLTSSDTDLPTGATFTLQKSWTPGDGAWATHVYTNQRFLYSTDKTKGNTYNWYTLVAQTATKDDFNIIAPGSLCPSGWKLPTNTIYNRLILSTYNIDDNNTRVSEILTSFPFSYIMSGYYNSGELILPNDVGEYWTSQAAPVQTDEIIRARRMVFYSETGKEADGSQVFYKTGTRTRAVGNAARCVAK